jgi:hypothetical protein
MLIRTIVTVGASALALAACGSTGGRAAPRAGPPPPVNVSVFVGHSRIAVSPHAVGAGPVILIVTNQARRSEAVAISPAAHHSHPLASTAPINPQGTTQIAVEFRRGDYVIAAVAHGRSDADRSRALSIAPATLHVGRRRGGFSDALLQPWPSAA